MKNGVLAKIALMLGLMLAMPTAGIKAEPEATPVIADNSFLIEEAYNQEPGVVQHINFFQYNQDSHAWDYTFTQEWPIVSQDHQFSYTLPASRVTDDEDNSGLGDILVNYRYQAVLREGTAFAPRVSLIVPSGDADEGLGSDAIGYQVNLPLSVDLSECVVMHWNMGATFVPDARASGGGRANNTSFNYGASLVYLMSPTFNLMLEMVGSSDEETVADDTTEHTQSFFVSPGFRYAFNFESGLQIVPGFAMPVGFGDSEGEYGYIGYLSFEHPF